MEWVTCKECGRDWLELSEQAQMVRDSGSCIVCQSDSLTMKDLEDNLERLQGFIELQPLPDPPK